MKTFQRILVALVIVFVFFVSLRNFIVKVSAEKAMRVLTGLPMEIGRLDIGLLKSEISIKDLFLFNPEGFEEKIMLDLPEAYVNYNLRELIQGKVHFNELRIHLNEFIVVRNHQGELNLNYLKISNSSSRQTTDSTQTQYKKEKTKIKIDRLYLKIGTVIYKDYSSGGKPNIQTFKINIDKTYKDITNPRSILNLIVIKALTNTTIATFTDFDFDGIKNALGKTLSVAQKVVSTAADVAKESIRITTETVTGAAKATGKKIKETADGLVNKLLLPSEKEESP